MFEDEMRSIAALGAAADRLTAACEDAMQRSPTSFDPKAPARTGVIRSLRDTFRLSAITPPDMAAQLKRLSR
jgi:hypothetical protein